MEYIADLGARNIICGTIRQAIRDWKSAYYTLEGRPTEEECKEILEVEPDNKSIKNRLYQIRRAKYYKADTEIFFKSPWYKELKEASGVPLPQDMISALQEKIEQEKKEKAEKEKKKHEREIGKECGGLDSGESEESEGEEGDNRGEGEEADNTPSADSGREEELCGAEEG